MAPGDMGSSVIRTPIALWIAFAIAASGGTMQASPTPRTPKACAGLDTCITTALGRVKRRMNGSSRLDETFFLAVEVDSGSRARVRLRYYE